MTFSVFETTLYGYSILDDNDNGPTYTIRLHTKFHQTAQATFNDIVFTHTIAHHFEDYRARSELFDIEAMSIEASYKKLRKFFEKRAHYGWPFPHHGGRDLLAQANAHGVKAYQITPAYGFNGWVWARSIALVARDKVPQFDEL